MTIVFGGAYQGKTAYAKEAFLLSDADIFVCEEKGTPDLSLRAVSHLERFSLACVRAGKEPLDELRRLAPCLGGKVLLSDDISCGVVPVEAELRAWREAHGRMMNALCKEADSVIRVFCSLPQVLK